MHFLSPRLESSSTKISDEGTTSIGPSAEGSARSTANEGDNNEEKGEDSNVTPQTSLKARNVASSPISFSTPSNQPQPSQPASTTSEDSTLLTTADEDRKASAQQSVKADPPKDEVKPEKPKPPPDDHEDSKNPNQVKPPPPPQPNPKEPPDRKNKKTKRQMGKKRKKKQGKNDGEDNYWGFGADSVPQQDDDDFVVTSPIYEPRLLSENDSDPDSPVSQVSDPDSPEEEEFEVVEIVEEEEGEEKVEKLSRGKRTKKRNRSPPSPLSPTEDTTLSTTADLSTSTTALATSSSQRTEEVIAEVINLAESDICDDSESDTDPELELSESGESPKPNLKSPDVEELNKFLIKARASRKALAGWGRRRSNNFTAGGYATSPAWEDSPDAPISPEYSPKSPSCPLSPEYSPRSPSFSPLAESPTRSTEGLLTLLDSFNSTSDLANAQAQNPAFQTPIMRQLTKEKAALDAHFPTTSLSSGHHRPPRPSHSPTHEFPPTSPYHDDELDFHACPVDFNQRVPTNDTRIKQRAPPRPTTGQGVVQSQQAPMPPIQHQPHGKAMRMFQPAFRLNNHRDRFSGGSGLDRRGIRGDRRDRSRRGSHSYDEKRNRPQRESNLRGPEKARKRSRHVGKVTRTTQQLQLHLILRYKQKSESLSSKLRAQKKKHTKEITELKSLLLKAKMDLLIYKEKIKKREKRLRESSGGDRDTRESKRKRLNKKKDTNGMSRRRKCLPKTDSGK